MKYNRWYEGPSEHRPLDECVNGALYNLRSRNLHCGVYNEKRQGFIGIREKFGDLFLFMEYHYDTGSPFGTAHPYEELAKCPLLPVEGMWIYSYDSIPDGFILKYQSDAPEKSIYLVHQALFDWLTPYDEHENERAKEIFGR